FTDLETQTVFVRPAYYLSNWLRYLPVVEEQGILPTFYPVDLKIPMLSPLDVAAFIADLMAKPIEGSPIYELEGPDWYSSDDVAATLSTVLKRPVEAHQTPRDQ